MTRQTKMSHTDSGRCRPDSGTLGAGDGARPDSPTLGSGVQNSPGDQTTQQAGKSRRKKKARHEPAQTEQAIGYGPAAQAGNDPTEAGRPAQNCPSMNQAETSARDGQEDPSVTAGILEYYEDGYAYVCSFSIYT
jgi:hypothetical protein